MNERTWEKSHLLAFLYNAIPQVFAATGVELQRISNYLLYGLLRAEA